MTTELEKQFFDTFGIEPQTGIGLVKFKEAHYPQITDRHYLEMIVIHNIYIGMKLYHLDIKGLKEEILQDLIDEQELRDIKKEHVSDDFKHQVQQLFKE